jgi:hypothetical protein
MADIRTPAQRSTTRFADRFDETDLGTQAVLEQRLTFLVRRVLRSGSGSPALVRWVRDQLSAAPPSDDGPPPADQLARRLGLAMQSAGRAPALAGFDAR